MNREYRHLIYLAVIIPAHSHPHPTDGSFAIQPMPYMPSGASVVSNCNATLCDGSTNPTTESGSLQQEIAFLSPRALRLGVNLHRPVQLTECAHKTTSTMPLGASVVSNCNITLVRPEHKSDNREHWQSPTRDCLSLSQGPQPRSKSAQASATN